MRKSQQAESRRRSARLFRKRANLNKLKRQWLSAVVQPLRRQRLNNRLNRMIRRQQILGW